MRTTGLHSPLRYFPSFQLNTPSETRADLADALRDIRRAALDESPVAGLTHQHYKYPARFSPAFVAAAIGSFSKHGSTVLDPYMGGGTTIVEALVAGRRAVGCDINSLAVFVSHAKTVPLNRFEVDTLADWALMTAQSFNYHDALDCSADFICSNRTRNLTLPRARATKKYLSLALASCKQLPTLSTQNFARCVLLNVGQWALNGRKRAPSLIEFRRRVAEKTLEMLRASEELSMKVQLGGSGKSEPILMHCSAEELPIRRPFCDGALADLVVTSPPYPGVHVLYHRWQVDGRRETPAPYWIANCMDGQGDAHYNFGSRKQSSQDDYFDASLRTLQSIRKITRTGAMMVQMLAFSNPHTHLERYLQNMELAGFREVRLTSQLHRRIWRRVPGRSWHAEQNGVTNSAREVVLIHEAV